jgi:hypothetical protein
LKSNNVVPETGADAPPHTGLDKPQYTINLTCSGGKTVKLLVGDPLAIGDAVYVKIDGHDKIDVVNNSLVTALDKPASDLRKTQLFDTASSSIQQLTITHKDGSQLVLEKQPKGWQIIKPSLMPADQFSVDDLLSAIINMTPVSFVDDPNDAIGLNKPVDTVTFSTTAPSTQPSTTTTQPAGVTIKFGGYDDVEKKNVFVQLPDGGIVKAASSMLDTLNKKPLELRDKTVVDLDPEKIQSLSIAITQPATTQPVAPAVDRTVLLQRRPKETRLGPTLPATKPTTGPTSAPAAPATVWVIAGAKPFDADDAKITALLGQFHPLKADKFREAPAPSKARQFVLTFTVTGQPAVVLTLSDPGNESPLVGSYGGLTFEIPRTIATDLSGEFKK